MTGLMAGSLRMASVGVGPLEFRDGAWLWLIPIAWGVVLWISRRSIAGLATGACRGAIAIRLLVIAILIGALADPHWLKDSESVGVVVVLDASRSVPLEAQERAEAWVEEAARAKMGSGDRLGYVTVASDPRVHLLVRPLNRSLRKTEVGRTDATDLAGGITTSLAIAPADAALRILLISDGNETEGSLLGAAQQARAEGVPIDVLPVRYTFDREVIVEDLAVPPTSREGETLNVRVVMTSKSSEPARGILSILLNGEPVDIAPAEDGFGRIVELEPGMNVFDVPIKAPSPGPQEFTATFDPLPDGTGRVRDQLVENNRAMAVTFVSGRGAVLILTTTTREVEHLTRALREANIAHEVHHPDDAPQSLTQLNAYDCVILANVPVYHFSRVQQEELVQYVHDSGGGLIMTGGPEAFGAGGWIHSPVAEALPVKLDPPQKRRMPRGALVLIMHSVEIRDARGGVYWGKQTAKAAVRALTRLDLAGIVEHTPMNGTQWAHPLSEIGDGVAINRAIDSLQYGDMPGFDQPLLMALEGLLGVEAGAKHLIIISDGDPTYSRGVIQRFAKARITISAVGVMPHSKADLARLKTIADITKGNFYPVTEVGNLATIPEIFFKESQTVRRPLTWEGSPFVPARTGVPSEPLAGIASVPPITGYVVGADRGAHALVTLRGKENDPLLAHWQYGMGRAVALMTDAATRWAANWIGWSGYTRFWEQHVRWAMRPAGDANTRVHMRTEGTRTRIIVEATDPSGERLNFARFEGRVANPDGSGAPVALRQVGPGRYEGEFETASPGAYIASLRYAAPAPDGGTMEGMVQAAVTRPFADEFRALSDNAPLLRRVAEMTGGRVLDPSDPAAENLWARSGLSMPVSATPIWLPTALAALALFVGDVAVRRVRVDLGLLRGALARAFSTSTRRGGEQLETLRGARTRAREAMAARASSREVAERKFEAPPVPREGGPASPVSPAPREGAKVEKRARDAREADEEGGGEEGISRLLKAKRRAREDYEEGDS